MNVGRNFYQTAVPDGTFELNEMIIVDRNRIANNSFHRNDPLVAKMVRFVFRPIGTAMVPKEKSITKYSPHKTP